MGFYLNRINILDNLTETDVAVFYFHRKLCFQNKKIGGTDKTSFFRMNKKLDKLGVQRFLGVFRY